MVQRWKCSEMYKEGRTLYMLFRADIDYAHAESFNKVGIIGVKSADLSYEHMVKDLTPHGKPKKKVPASI